MKKNIAIIITLVFSISFGFSQIPVEKYRKEIKELETETEINEYWNNLYKIDQEVLLVESNVKTADSISISNMIKTALIFDIHGTKGYNSNDLSGILTIINLSHNQIGKSQIAYWPIIEKCKEIGGAINSFGGKYPAYELESVSHTFYNYSLSEQEQKYPSLLKKLSDLKTNNVVDKLVKSLESQDEIRKLKEVKILNEWYLQSIKNQKEEGKFSIIKMSDDNLYLKKHGRKQRLELIKTNSKSKIYRIENEPFGWNYIYGEDSSLSLIDSEQNELINYTLAK